jgi:guanylate kinase
MDQVTSASRQSPDASRSGRLVLISGPSGVGKTSICSALLAHGGMRRVITATSRPPRPGERDGVDYHFLSEARFQEAIRRGEFLEHAKVHGHLYGTPREEVAAGLREGRPVLLNIDVQGARQIREKVKADEAIPLTQIFLMPPSLEELERRLETRKTDDPAVVKKRLETAIREMEERTLYDHVVVNDDLAATVSRILALLGLPGKPNAEPLSS